MERKIDQVLENWFENRNHKALVLRGPRQVGKSYAIRRLGAKRYDTMIEINFEDHPDYRSIFEDDLSADAIFERMSFIFVKERFEGCLLFLDEIQCCPGAFSALKPMVEDGRCDIACSGSVLSEMVANERLTPMGSIELEYMSPMDFEEFLWAMGFSHAQTETIRSHIRNNEPFDNFVLNQLNDLFKRYVVIGGMPAAVSAYAKSHMYSDSYRELDGIVKLLSDDISRYVKDPTDRIRIEQCIESIPRQLSREKNSSFLYSDISIKAGYGQREYGPAIAWLEGAGIVDICRNIEEVSEPFKVKMNGNMFKIYVRDTGVLVHMLGPAVAKGVMDGEYTINNGAVIEDAVAEALIRKGYKVHYYSNPSRRMELDFVFNYNGKLAVIEVKSGRKKSAKSLNKALTEDRAIDVAMKISSSNLSVDENGVYHYPLFGPCFFEDCHVLELPPMNNLNMLMEALDRKS